MPPRPTVPAIKRGRKIDRMVGNRQEDDNDGSPVLSDGLRNGVEAAWVSWHSQPLSNG
jgi:hypothetical protein